MVKALERPKLTNLHSGETDQPIVLRVENLCKTFGGQTVLDGVSLSLQQSEVVLLRGVNGSGKTTLLNILTGNLLPDKGTLEISNHQVRKTFSFPVPLQQRFNVFAQFTPEQVAQAGVGRTWQDIRLFTTQTLRDNIAIATPNQLGENPLLAVLHPKKVQKQTRRTDHAAEARLAALGLEGRENSSADKVSLGQSKRVAIARTLQSGARILFLDEPLAGLDASGVTEIMHLLRELSRNEQVTLIIVEHVFNIPRVLELATTVWTLEKGKITVETPLQAQATLDHVASSDELHAWVQQTAGTDDRVSHQPLPGGAILSTVTPVGKTPGPVVLEINDLVAYRGKRLIIGERKEDGTVQGLSLVLRQGELALLQAPNGWGKTTLLEAIAGILPITRGVIQLQGRAVQNLPSWERVKLGLSMLQARDNVFPRLTVREALRLSHVMEIPESIKPFLAKRMSALSGGEKQKVTLACAMNRKAFTVGLLDEPFSALDQESVSDAKALVLERLRSTGLLIAVPIGINHTVQVA